MRRSEDGALLLGNRTDVGRQREKNEDYLGYWKVNGRQLFVVADGMGGEVGGQVASRTAVEAVQNYFAEHAGESPEEMLGGAVREANSACLLRQVQEPELKGMGTTLELLMVEGGKAFFAHVGDSRIILIRRGKAQQLTKDHTQVQRMMEAGLLSEEEAAEHPQRNVIYKVIGHDDTLDPDISTVPIKVEDGDAFLMCSDGLTDLVTPEEIAYIASHYGPQRGCDELVNLANRRGGHDNITIQIIYQGRAKRAWQKIKPFVAIPPTPKTRRYCAIALISIISAAVAAGLLFLSIWLMIRHWEDQLKKPQPAASRPAPTPQAESGLAGEGAQGGKSTLPGAAAPLGEDGSRETGQPPKVPATRISPPESDSWNEAWSLLEHNPSEAQLALAAKSFKMSLEKRNVTFSIYISSVNKARTLQDQIKKVKRAKPDSYKQFFFLNAEKTPFWRSYWGKYQSLDEARKAREGKEFREICQQCFPKENPQPCELGKKP